LSGNRTAANRRTFDRLLFSTLKNMNIFRLLTFAAPSFMFRWPRWMICWRRNCHLTAPFTAGLAGRRATDRRLDAQLDGLRGAGCVLPLSRHVTAAAPPLCAVSALDYLVLDFAAPIPVPCSPCWNNCHSAIRNCAGWHAISIPPKSWPCAAMPKISDGLPCFTAPICRLHTAGSARKEGANQGRVLEIMRLLRANAPTAEVEAQFKLDSVLLFKLLRFVNSPVNGLSRKIQTIEDGLMLLGRNALFKWLSLLLFTSESDSGATLSLLEKSLIRAHFMEELGIIRGNKLEAEHLFLTGMFSAGGPAQHAAGRSAGAAGFAIHDF
jgi:EAL and modified HD-GYP domain-containing signal transduction protein